MSKKATERAEKIQDLFSQLLESNFPRLQKDIKTLSSKDRAMFFLAMAEFLAPKLSRTKLVFDKESVEALRSWVIVPVTNKKDDDEK